MSAKKLATVILHYGSVAPTARLFEQLRQSDPSEAGRLWVLDNASPEIFPEAWKRLPENLYWAGALEFACNVLAAEGFSHVWFLNNDISFRTAPPHRTRAWERLAWIERRLGRAAGLYSPAADVNPYHPQMTAKSDCQYRTASVIDGIAPLINLECLREIGGVDFGENPYGYGVDMWLSLRAHRANWPVVVDHQVVVRHAYHGAARQVEGFLQLAAGAERDYLAKRLGPDWSATLSGLKLQCTDWR
ncbi:MAG: hypothetical protein HQK81_12210 [Desulfovibrionaceae bacterium]|nr:hypothetical protein [Desulfovibrionaceae bacterium]MBF0514807.1 hypothetical protein [Desulfovibrionaceae bacterium]